MALLLVQMHNLLLTSSHWSEIHRPGLPLVKLRGWVTELRAMAQSWNTCSGKPTKLQVPWTCFFKNLVVLEMRMRDHACMQLNLSILPLIRKALCLNKMPLKVVGGWTLSKDSYLSHPWRASFARPGWTWLNCIRIWSLKRWIQICWHLWQVKVNIAVECRSWIMCQS